MDWDWGTVQPKPTVRSSSLREMVAYTSGGLGVGVGVGGTGVGVGGGGGTSRLPVLTDAQTLSSSQPVTLAMYHLSRVTLLNDTLPGLDLVVLL